MSGHYSASQFNDAFKAKRLQNWQYGINHPGKFSNRRCCPTNFIADNRGYLLCHAQKDPCTSPWGDYRLSIWEETSNCHCVDRVRNPQHYDRPPCSIVVTRERPQHLREAKVTSAALAKTLFQPPPQPEVSVIVKNNQNTPAIESCSDASFTSKGCAKPKNRNIPTEDYNNNKCPNNVPTTNDNNENDGTNNSPSLAMDINPAAFPHGVIADVDISQLQHGAIVDIGPTNNNGGCFTGNCS